MRDGLLRLVRFRLKSLRRAEGDRELQLLAAGIVADQLHLDRVGADFLSAGGVGHLVVGVLLELFAVRALDDDARLLRFAVVGVARLGKLDGLDALEGDRLSLHAADGADARDQTVFLRRRLRHLVDSCAAASRPS